MRSFLRGLPVTAAISAGAAILAGLASVAAALLALGLVALSPMGPGGRAGPRLRVAAAVLVAGAWAVALCDLVFGLAPARWELPFLLAGVRPELALDAVSGFFLVALLPVGVAGLAAGAAPGGVAVLLAGVVLAVLAGEGATLALGVALAAGAAALRLRDAAAGRWPMAWVGWLAVPALAMVLAVPGGDLRFAALRINPPDGAVAAAMLGLVLAGGGAVAGLVPWHGWLGRVAGRAEGGLLAAALVTGLGAYLLVRVGFDLAGPGEAWWGVPLMLAGAAGAMRGAARAAQAGRLDAVLAGAAVAQAGLVALALGIALAARAVDDGPTATMALSAALFGVLAFGWTQALWAVVAGAVAEGAGSLELSLLGGLAQRMRLTTIGALAGGLALAVLPPGAGFAALWLMAQAAVTLPRGGGADWWALALLALAVLAVAGGLLGFAVARVLGVAFLGRPRAPRAAAADEVAPALRWVMLVLSAAVLGCGLLPVAVLTLAAPAVRFLAGPVGQGVRLAGTGWDGAAPLGLALLLALAGALVAAVVRARSPAGHRVAPAWDGGQGPAPAWLPFGDPATQIGAVGFAQPLADGLGKLAGTPRLGLPGISRRAARLVARGRALGEPARVGAVLLAMLLLYLVGAW